MLVDRWRDGIDFVDRDTASTSSGLDALGIRRCGFRIYRRGYIYFVNSNVGGLEHMHLNCYLYGVRCHHGGRNGTLGQHPALVFPGAGPVGLYCWNFGAAVGIAGMVQSRSRQVDRILFHYRRPDRRHQRAGYDHRNPPSRRRAGVS